MARQYKLPFKLVHGAWQVHFFDGDFARVPLGGAENFHANVTRIRSIIFCRDILDDLLVDRFRIFKVFNVSCESESARMNVAESIVKMGENDLS